ncbi:hypothetical protein HMI01_23780 [Halolactibacillus miurensis]|uniref:2-keto-4-pentenoate hydratase/2-oxohepta-3-ene-1,7-dioic acid hydratase (Catechol pathway) n=1 Tax=Halolactibacillus miurensis TaxID=306541 RepID=A0A1I6UP81_9BACI|nr:MULTISPECIES: fumarylacetoacetate hydrolase family protein [Halolactibacillus]GEM05390.1 hypothetical protein HMI01_23780 [Halolactibacillus miurensis]SFT03276.1 2-keto-4-pentenoate hydratase/2-oxohepta-3-ene-1,7-dioic acid hydratase (catechol pathway) [Halolactibacillus miurensis]
MRILTYRLKDSKEAYQVGFLKDTLIYPVDTLKTYIADEAVKQLVTSDPALFYLQLQSLPALKAALEKASQSIGIKQESIEFGPVVTRPSKIICVGVNYLDHVKEMGHDVPKLPVLFSKFSNALIGHEANIMGMAKSDQLDYEVELACVIGKTCTEVDESEALDYLLGYTIANDISARDLQKRTPQWLQGKTLDKSTPVGPVIVTTDELKDPSKLAIRSYVNGDVRQTSSTDQLIFNIPTLIAFISDLITLEPGDLILTGTPHGVGFAEKPPRLLQSGDEVVCEIEGIGTLKNKVD